ncbi:MAG: acyltransferase [Nitrospirae bacterium]|nr:acyltransferase [Nitrospirota bacterium]
MKKFMNSTRIYYPELDSLRFIAFLLVLIHHSPFAEVIPAFGILIRYGWIGVDLFLCLSAFMFARLLFVEYQREGNINIAYFYIRRALRIWPLYYIFFGITLIYSIYLYGWSSGILYRSLGMLTFTDNLFSMSLGYNHFIAYTAHLWTISYEEQFYLVIPWALRVFYRLKKTTTIYILGTVMLMGVIIRAGFIYYKIGPPAIWVFPFTHFESILGGLIIGLGLFDQYLKKIPVWILLIAGIIALWPVTILQKTSLIQWKLMLTYPLIGIGMSLILFAIMQGGLGPISVLFRNKLFRYLGKISYGLYVYHIACGPLAFEITNTFVSQNSLLVYPAARLTIRLIVTVLVSTMSYEILEKPFLRLKERFTFIHSRPI